MFTIARSLYLWGVTIPPIVPQHDHEWKLRSSPGREGAEGTRPPKIEVPFCPRVDYFSDLLRGTRPYAQEVASSSA